MEIGFLIHPEFSRLSFEDVIRWVSENGFKVVDLEERWPENIEEVTSKYGIKVGATQVWGDIFTAKSDELEENIKKICGKIESTAQIGVKVIVTFLAPLRLELSLAENFKIFERVCPRIIECAEDNNVKIALENWPGGGNLSYSPEIWEKIFEVAQSKNMGLCLDPSHLYWLGIDYVRAVEEFGEKIYYAHAKDVEILEDGLFRYSILSRQFAEKDAYGSGWWRYRLPGFGEINWAKFISALYEVDYKGVISIEHEDPLWSQILERVKKGFILAKRFLEQYI